MIDDPDDPNAATLRVYETHAGRYVAETPHQIAAPTRQWLDRAVDGLPPSARILELGSAFGRDAAYLQSFGFRVVCSDAADSFVRELEARGFSARRLNALTDDIADRYDLIVANAVLLHFTRPQFATVLAKLWRALDGGGRLAFSLKAGEGEGWSDAKLGVPRYFCYWTGADVQQRLTAAGFVRVEVIEASTDRAHARWLYAIAARATG